MVMRDDFGAFILSHGRPDRVHTYKTLQKTGYTGKVFIVIDDEDPAEAEYRKIYGSQVLQFCKREYAEKLDAGDNKSNLSSTIYVRAALFDLARENGCKYFIQLDDDYTEFMYRYGEGGKAQYNKFRRTTNEVFEELVKFLEKSNALTIAMAQGGDFIGGGSGISLRRKAMNSFVCSVDRPWVMTGRMNEDVTTYVVEGRRGRLFFTTTQLQLCQLATQGHAGGMTELYLSSGTYVKSFYSVMYAPSCVQIGTLVDPRTPDCNWRIHHKINWNKTAPKIIREEYKK